jgi:hypothetical protein
MKYYNFITLDNWQIIQNKFLTNENIISSNKNIIMLSKNEQEWIGTQILQNINNFTQIEHKISNAIIFIQKPNIIGTVHVDGITPGRVGHPNWALNIPITNSDAEMLWYKGKYTLHSNDSHGVSYLDIQWQSEPIVDCKIKVNKPVIVNIDAPHSVSNYSNNLRAILSVRFYPDLKLYDTRIAQS